MTFTPPTGDMPFTLRQLRYFVTAARTGSMAATAVEVHVSPAAVSLGIAELERGLASTLFLRVPHRPLALTTVGRTLLPRALAVLAEADGLGAAAADQAESVHGTARVGCFETLGPLVANRLISKGRRLYPDLHIDIVEGDSSSLQAGVLDGLIDIAVLYGIELDNALEVRPLWAQRPHVVVAGGHRLARRRRLHLRELADEPMILLGAPPSRDHSLSLLRDLGLDPPVARTIRSFETLRALVAGGHGWSILVQRPATDLTFDGLELAVIEIADRVEPAPVVAAFGASARPSRRVQACLDVFDALRADEDAPAISGR